MAEFNPTIFDRFFGCVLTVIFSLLFSCNSHAMTNDLDLSFIEKIYSDIESFVTSYQSGKNLKTPEIVIPKILTRDGRKIPAEEKNLMKIALEQFLRELNANDELAEFSGIYQKKKSSFEPDYPAFNYISKPDNHLYVFTIYTRKISPPYGIYDYQTLIGLHAVDFDLTEYLQSKSGENYLICRNFFSSDDSTDADLISLKVCIDPNSREVTVFEPSRKIDQELSREVSKLVQNSAYKNKIISLIKKYIMRSYFKK